MTKQEYEAKNQQLRDAYICDSDYFGRLVDVDSEYIESLEAENAALTLLHTQATDEMLKMQNRVHKLEAEIAQLKKDKLEFNAQCFHKDETISVLKNRITELEFDNRYLVEQMNAMAMKPNQEVIEWHQHPLYPETSRCCIVECTDNCFYVAHHSDIDGWLNAATYEQLSNVKSWAYLPIGANHENTDKKGDIR